MHAVIYCDGGYRPSEHLGGFGVHGYVYDPNIEKPKGLGLNKVFATDKGYVKEKENAILVEPIFYYDLFCAIYSAYSNNLSEVEALYYSLMSVDEHLSKEVTSPITSLTILTDSKYAMEGLIKANTLWKFNNWTLVSGDRCKNIELWKKIEPLYDSLLKKMDIKFIHIAGHSGEYGNDIVDSYANKAMDFADDRKYRNYEKFNWILGDFNIKITNAKGYWKKPERTTLTSSIAWYVDITEPDIDIMGYHGYMLADIPSDVEDGRASPELITQLVCTKEPIELLEDVKDILIDKECHSKVGVVRIDLADIYDRVMYKDIKEFGSSLVKSKGRKFNLMAPNNKPFAKEPSPSGLIFVSIKNYEIMTDALTSYLQGDKSIIKTSLKDLLYEDLGKGLVLKKQYAVSTKFLETTISVDTGAYVGNINYRFLFGYDIPKRNLLNRMSETLIDIFFISWRQSDNAVTFMTVVELEEGFMIMSNIDTSTLFIPDKVK